jgi:hypothetical protein
MDEESIILTLLKFSIVLHFSCKQPPPPNAVVPSQLLSNTVYMRKKNVKKALLVAPERRLLQEPYSVAAVQSYLIHPSQNIS